MPSILLDSQQQRTNQFVELRFHLNEVFKANLKARTPAWGFGSFSQAVFYRSYSRTMEDGTQETWADTIIRVVEGIMSIRKDWLVRVLGKRWDEQRYQHLAQELAEYMFDMKVLPPGRGLWALGTDYVYERGSMSLNNCGFCAVTDTLSKPASWAMDSLMCGVGVGASSYTASNLTMVQPSGDTITYVIPDSREGWVESVKQLISSYEQGSNPIEFDYSLIRPAGMPIRGFGGTAAGSEPLEKLHDRLRFTLRQRAAGNISTTRMIADVFNGIGACVVAGNVRRSAEILVGSPTDKDFLNLKNYELNPERQEIGWMSNNAVALHNSDDFTMLPELAPLVQSNGEPGVLNMININKYGRLGDHMHDAAIGINPCAEIPLENYELCCLSEVFPTRCGSTTEIYKAMQLATFYASTVVLLKSHSEDTNDVVARNRRIGVSVSGVADWIDATSVSHVFDVLNSGYECYVRPTNKALAEEAGVAESVRVTTCKPSGSISLLAGVSPGCHYPTDSYVLRRMRVAKDSPVADILKKAGVNYEDDVYTPNTLVFDFPLRYGNGKTRSVKKVSIYEQASVVAMLQKCWADNAVSNTLVVQPKEFNQIEKVLSYFAPQVKSMSLLPDLQEGAYAQMPLESITASEYKERVAKAVEPDWSALTGSDGEDQRFCTNDACTI